MKNTSLRLLLTLVVSICSASTVFGAIDIQDPSRPMWGAFETAMDWTLALLGLI
jgi:hypothetical protein